MAESISKSQSFWSPRHRQFLLFVLAAGASVPVNIGARILFSSWMRFEAAVFLSHIVGMVTAYGLTKLLVFEKTGRNVASELGRFAVVNVISVAQTWLVSVGLLYWVFPWLGFNRQPELVAHVLGLGLASLTSFVGHSRYSFQKAGNALG